MGGSGGGRMDPFGRSLLNHRRRRASKPVIRSDGEVARVVTGHAV